jgi:hypothetical protein
VDIAPETLAKLERLAAVGVRIVPAPGLERYLLLEKEGLYALVEHTPGGFGAVGSPGIMTEQGFAPLILGGKECAFVCKSYRQTATRDEVTAVRSFFTQLKQALS